MANKRPVSPLAVTALEYGPLIAFFVGYSRWKDDVFTFFGTDYSGFIVVTACFIPLMILSTGALWALTGKLSRMQVLTLVLVVVFGGLTVWLNDETFFKMKPTIIYLLFAAILGFGLLRGQSYLSSLLGTALPLTEEGWLVLTKRIAGLFLGMALANEVIWRLASTDLWVNFKTIGLPLIMVVFFMTQMGLIKKYSPDQPEA